MKQLSNQRNHQVLDRIQMAQSASLILTVAISATILVGWLLSAVGTPLPPGWSLMKVNTAIAFLLATASLSLSAKLDRPTFILSRVCVVAVMTIAGSALFAYWTGHSSRWETLLVADNGTLLPGRMSIQTGIYLELVGGLLALDGLYWPKARYVRDILTLVLVLVVLSILAGYIFGAAKLFGQTSYTRVAPQTLACMILFAFALVTRGAERGMFSVLVGNGIGSQTARLSLPFAIVLPFLIVTGSSFSTQAQWMSAPYAAAVAAATFSTLIFAFVLLMARRINNLERELRDASLTDELTDIYNRRAFYLLGEQALRMAHRNHQHLTILFFDLNDLKTINDTLGHDSGSRALREAADLLRRNFRSSDIVARIGGDEFAVATHARVSELMPVLRRLDDATAAVNKANKSLYRISFSMGDATSEPETREDFVELVDRADAVMYERKRQRKAGRAAGNTQESGNFDPLATGVMAAYIPAKIVTKPKL